MKLEDWTFFEFYLMRICPCFHHRIDYLCHDISVHIPHHIASKIPSYNLRKAYASLQENWDKHLNKAEFGIPLMTTIVTQCNLFDDKKKKWVKFDKSSRDGSSEAAAN